MSINLEKELKFMAEEYGLSEKQVLNWWRTAVRQMWANSPFKLEMIKNATYDFVNDNPKTMSRYPTVKRIDCEHCKGSFSPANVELDHIDGDNKMSDLSEAESFMKSILFTPKSNLQWLCADQKKTRNKKRVTASVGCHAIKTQIEANPSLTKHEAWCIRELKRIVKYENLLDKLIEFGVESTNVPKTKKAQEELMYKLLLEVERYA